MGAASTKVFPADKVFLSDKITAATGSRQLYSNP